MRKRALVTGGAGFVGSHLCERLVRDGWVVEAVDNLCTGRAENLSMLDGSPAFVLRRADISWEPLRPPNAEEPVDVVFHLACPASPVQYRRLALETLQVCSLGTAAALAEARRHGAAFLFTSTSEVYGDPLVHPQPESYFGNVDPVGPRSMYDEGKRYAEALCTWTARERGVDVRIVRIFNTYGPRMDLHDGRVVPTFVRQALADEPLTVHGDGSQTRSFCYVDDLVDGLVRAATASRGVINESPTNLGNPAELTMREIAERILELTGSTSEIQYVERPSQDPERRRPDIARAREILGWEPKVNLVDGLRATIDWARASG
jgi:dTDP-glucose 4,6-dehydratase